MIEPLHPYEQIPVFRCDRCGRPHLSEEGQKNCCTRQSVWPDMPTQSEVSKAIAKLPSNPFDPSFGKTNIQKYPKYFKDVTNLKSVDIYAVCKLFGVSDASGALQHAIKKLLLSGVRTGGKSPLKDIEEARDTLNRYLEIHK